jgi:hypothetical protein
VAGATWPSTVTSPVGVATGGRRVRSATLRGAQPRCTSTVVSDPVTRNGVTTKKPGTPVHLPVVEEDGVALKPSARAGRTRR